jgi:tripartite-type tricarboxylate transporter receptor subunit TctC
MAAAPDVPTVAELGFPGFDAQAWLGLFGPGGMPPALVERIRTDVVAALAAPEVQERLATLGVVSIGSTPAELQALIVREIPRMAGVLQAAGMRGE